MRILLLTAVFAALVHSPVEAQAGRAWVINPGVSILRVDSDADDWGIGPSLAIRRDFGVRAGVARRWGVELTAAAPAFGGNNAGGVAADLGATLTWGRPRTELGLAAGVSALLVGDDSELVGGGIGGFVGAHGTVWLGSTLGLFAETRGRLAGVGGAYVSGSAGISVRL